VLVDVAFPNEPDLVPTARRLVSRAVAGRDPRLVDAAELIVTELVTNAVLHGAAPVAVRLADTGEHVRIEVEDRSHRMPVIPQHSIDQMTGRGLSLVAALSSTWGVDPLPHGGKVIWADVGVNTHNQGPDRVDLDDLLDVRPASSQVRHTVRLGAVPTHLLLQAKAHIENVVRELQLAGANRSGLAPAAVALIETVTQDFAEARTAIKRQALAAAERGDPTTDLVLHLPASAAAAGERYLAALDEVDRYAEAARLLTLESPPDHRVFRRWYVQALVDQLRALGSGKAPAPPPTLLEAVAEHVRGLTAQQQASDRLRLLQKVTAELTAAATVQDIAETVIGNATEHLNAVSGRILLLGDDAMLRTIPTSAGDQTYAQSYPELPLDADLPGSVVARTRQRLLLWNLHEIESRFPTLRGLYDTERSLHVAPLVVGDHCLGVFALTFAPGTPFDEAAQIEFVTALADALAQALERQLALQQAAEANERLQFLADAAVALNASLEYQDTIAAVTDLLVPRLADWCVVHVVENGQLRMKRAKHTQDSKSAWAEQMSERYGPKDDVPAGASHVVRTGVSELYPQIPLELVRQAAHDEEHLRLIDSLGIRSGLTVPLTGRTGTFGAVTLIYAESGRQYSDADVPLAEDVARRAALAIETARAFQEQSGRLATITRVAEAAQQAILVPPPQTAGPAVLSARYNSAAAEAQVGGDLYEVLARRDAVRLLIGDVRGKGLTAVRTATIVLGEFRAAAADMDDLASVARQMDRRVRQYLGEEDFVTALLAEVAADGTLTIASCGHPPAFLARAGRLELLHCEPTLPLGLGASPHLRVERLQIGDRLLLATDGLFEARDENGMFADVLDLLGIVAASPFDKVLDQVLQRVHAVVGHDQLGDDLALLLAEIRGPELPIERQPRVAALTAAG
jgi:serine phosphatase RsbU (regulator of sigma subunit)